ncbi:MAG: hypothetical protein A2Y10_11720 [Planctomycetes bacterium GWF2_41_51]|nr:MAG: hypothetical protein A2Y10_11720 [Planctomycetes bacterium GWF2_41_51]
MKKTQINKILGRRPFLYFSLLVFNFSLICVLIPFIAGCEQNSKIVNSNAPAKLSTADGLIKYVAPLPAVQNAQPWENPYGSGIIIETVHYKIYTTMLEPLMLKQIPAFVEAAWQQYQSQLPQSVNGGEKFKLYLFKDRAQWEQFTKSFTGHQFPIYQKIKKGAYYLNDCTVAYNIGRTRTFSVIGHEGWHQFCNRYFKYRLPSWLDEGIAQLFEESTMENGRFIFLPAKNYQRLGALKISIQNKKMIPLRTLISLNPGQVIANNQADSAAIAFYAQSYALVRFLREDNYGKRLGSYYQMMLGALNGTWPISESESQIASNRNIPVTAQWNSFIAQKLFSIYLNQEIEKIEPEYLAFCGKITYPISVKSY